MSAALPNTPGPDARLLHEFFADAARRHGTRTAIDVPPGPDRPARRRATYAELDQAACAIAAALAALVKGECVVAVLLPREMTEHFAAQLGVLESGAAYLCLDPAFPDEHARAILEDARPVALLADARGLRRARAAGWNAGSLLDVHALPAVRGGARHVPAWLTPRSLAYVIYTSGTTGRPKGVMIEHAGIANLVASDLEQFGLGPDDRVAQGSSAAYDSSVEETWLALASGATLVVLDDEAARRGPDLVGWLRDERVTVLCPTPTLLRAMGCDDPAVALPDLRLVYAGGEALPRDVADRWARGRWFENGYGPTECTVTVLRGRVRAGEPVTIGRPVRGNDAHVLDEALQPVPDGGSGELCIGGIGLARGYLNRPELTAARFPAHPALGRLYRTGDLVRRDARGDHHFLGRIDAQVKVRGHRIELGAIEACLARIDGVRAAACCVQGAGAGQVLCAFIVAADPARAPSFDDLRGRLAAALPAHMVPARFARLEALPTTTGGKLDRAALPVIAEAGPRPERVAPRDEHERLVAAAFEAALGHGAVSVEDDFFVTLGGDSLAAAVAVSRLRADPRTAHLTVRDVYAARTAAALAARAGRSPEARPEAPAPARDANPSWMTAAQSAWLGAALVVTSSLLYLAGLDLVPFLARDLGLVAFVLVSPLLLFAAGCAYAVLAIAGAVATKWLVIGRYRAGRFPVWSSLHLRHWIVQQMASLVPWTALQGTILQTWTLRALGARVGRHVHLHRGVNVARGGWDLLEIEDGVTVCQEAELRLVDLEAGELVVGAVRLGAESTVDIRAIIGPGASLGERACLAPLSTLPSGARIPDGERWDGVPAQPAGRAPEAPALDAGARPHGEGLHALALLALRLARVVAGPYALIAATLAWAAWIGGVTANEALAIVLDPHGFAPELVVVLALVVVAGPASALASALFVRAIGRVREGVIPVRSLAHLRVLAKTDAVRHAGDLLSGTLFWPAWLRLAGMRVGRKSEISTIIDVVPECVEIGDECFLADGIYLGGPRIHRGTVTLARTRIARDTFLGNHAVLPCGTELPAGTLVGVSTVADGRVRAGTSWFGRPAFELPRRAATEVDRALTHDPGTLRYVNRWLWEAARVLIPVLPVFVTLEWLKLAAGAAASGSALELHLLHLPAVSLAAGAVLCAATLALKWLLLGRVRPGRHALWSCWCSRWDFLYVAWGQWARPILSRLEGTLLLAPFLRAMGVSIGRRAVLGAGFAHVVDPDMLRIEDDATVNGLFQAHSFEDRVLKIDRVTIRRGASVGAGAVLFFGAEVGPGARVAPGSVVMKHERLTAGGRYEGSPVRPVARADQR